MVREPKKGNLEKNGVWKSNKLIEANYKLSLQEQRLIYLLTSQINNKDKDFEEYEFMIADIALKLNMDIKSAYREIQKAVTSLISRTMTINEPDGPLHISWLASAKYHTKKGSVSLAFAPRLKPYLLQLQGEFAKLELNNLISFRSVYSMRIYELLKQYQRIKAREFNIKDLKNILGITQKSYEIYNNFKRQVILKAEQELKESENSDIWFSFEEEKENRKVVRLRFFIHTKDRNGDIVSEQEIKEQKKIEVKTEKTKQSFNSDLVERLINFGVSKERAIKITQSYEREQIEVNIRHFEVQRDKGVGYLIRAIEENYAINDKNARKRGPIAVFGEIRNLNDLIE